MTKTRLGTHPTSAIAGGVIVLAGPPGAGKSTVARLLAEQFELSVHLVADQFWNFIANGRIAPYLPEAHHQNEVVVSVLADAAFRYAEGGYTVLYDGVLGPWFLDALREKSLRQAESLHYIVLRPDIATTLDRATARMGSTDLTDPGPVEDLHRQFLELGPLESHVVDSSGRTAAETAADVLAGVAAGVFRLG